MGADANSYGLCGGPTDASPLERRPAARHVLDSAGLQNVAIEPIPGELTDHYDPRSKVLRLSEGVYQNRTLAAVGIAAHEAGHALQDAEAYAPMLVRNAAVPMASIGSGAGIWMVILGAAIPPLRPLVLAGIILFAAVVFFQVINLPVEFNASSPRKGAIGQLGDHQSGGVTLRVEGPRCGGVDLRGRHATGDYDAALPDRPLRPAAELGPISAVGWVKRSSRRLVREAHQDAREPHGGARCIGPTLRIGNLPATESKQLASSKSERHEQSPSARGALRRDDCKRAARGTLTTRQIIPEGVYKPIPPGLQGAREEKAAFAAAGGTRPDCVAAAKMDRSVWPSREKGSIMRKGRGSRHGTQENFPCGAR